MVNKKEKKLKKLKKEKIKEIQNKKDKEEHGKPVKLTDENFSDIIQKDQLTVVDFWADWCAPCKTMGKIIEQLASEFKGKITFGKLNIDENPKITEKYQIQGVPTLIIFKDGEVKNKIVGVKPKQQLVAQLKNYL